MLLRSTRGPTRVEAPLDRPLLIGRAADADVRLDEPSISRRHALVRSAGDHVYLVDERSSIGTMVNGVRIAANTPVPLRPGDIVGIGPWAFRVVDPQTSDSTAGTRADDRGTIVERIRSTHDVQLTRVLDWMRDFSAAGDAHEIARQLARAAVALGVPRAAVLTPLGAGRFEPLASEGTASGGGSAGGAGDDGRGGGLSYSRSLLAEAAGGSAARLRDQPASADQQSIAELGITAAFALPIRVGDEVEAVFYCDARAGERAFDDDTIRLIDALGHAASLAITERRHGELAERQRAMARELESARVVQQGLLAAPAGAAAGWSYRMGSRPGAFVAGDLFDAVPIRGGGAHEPDGLAVVVGDVVGHGVGAGLAMAMTQSFLHAQLEFSADPVAAATAVNRYVTPRMTEGRFITAVIATLAPDGGASLVDAGHGHFCVVTPDGAERPPLSGTPPLGVDERTEYAGVQLRLRPGQTLAIYTDGVIEQTDAQGQAFTADRLHDVLAVAGRDADPEAVLALLDEHRGVTPLADDATLALLRYDG
jgi:serine phosphatase RsbU (regulator of sigma subunit)